MLFSLATTLSCVLLHLSVLSVASTRDLLRPTSLAFASVIPRFPPSAFHRAVITSSSLIILSLCNLLASRPLIVLAGCCVASPCTALSSTLVVTATFASASPCLAFAIKRRQTLLPTSNTPTTTTIERHLYCPLLPQLPSIATVKCQRPPLSIAVIKC
jgi:hypothetical protein